MPLYMDVHNNVDGLTEAKIAEAHRLDLQEQGKHNVKSLGYWYNADEGKIFCLWDAPSKEAAAAVHKEAHGGVADMIIEVTKGV